MTAIAIPNPTSKLSGAFGTFGLVMGMAMAMAMSGLLVRAVDVEQGGGAICEDTFPAATASRTDVLAAIALTDAGDCVTVPADASESWAGGITISGISLIGPGKDAGSPTVITAGEVTANKHATAITRLIGFRFTGADDHVTVNGDDTDAIFVSSDNYYFSNSSHMLTIATNGSLWTGDEYVNQSIVGGNHVHATIGNGAAGDAAWAAAHTMGEADTNGDKNNYFENCTITNFRDGFPDTDDGAKVVVRYCTITDSSIITHGGGSGGSGNDTSIYGCRQLEVYNNTFDRVDNDMGLNEWVKFRGCSGVVANNAMENADSPDGTSYPGKSEVTMNVGCDGGSYPRQYQPGQSTQTPDATPDHPISIFGNTGYGVQNIGKGANPTGCSDPASFLQENRDYVLSDTWWNPYTYPHPDTPE